MFHSTQNNREKIRPPTDAELLQSAHQQVEIYLVYLREHETRNDLFDTRELPISKESLVNAFRIVIATENRPNIRALLIKAGMTLAQFQDDIGQPMVIRPVTEPIMNRSDERRKADPARLRRFDLALLKLGEERIRLGRVFQSAQNIAERRPFHHA
ncbi:hypothetical protein [Neorhizobium alkalisoli]|uniref:Uncharacterized protein n=1 Tax=Neorhizobium alkalisoli TaxID=528178 RepID=A0A561QSX1_9HYPH|nr:hypothetical protein [Neorhizobium alkalisoli]TWF53417.1 hypothetical protein FHW37_104697 [Neorhizobium alkalisoli]